MTELTTAGTLHLAPVSREGTLFAHMAVFTAVSTLHDPLILTLFRTVSGFSTVATDLSWTLFRDMPDLSTLFAFLGAGNLAWLGAIARIVTFLTAYQTCWHLLDLFHLLLSTFATSMPELYLPLAMPLKGMRWCRTVAVGAFLHEPIHDEPGFSQTRHVLLSTLRPSFCQLWTTRLCRELEADHVALIPLALEVDDGVDIRDFLLLGDEVSVHVGVAEDTLQLGEGHLRVSSGVREDGL